jgi:hypothetical protein
MKIFKYFTLALTAFAILLMTSCGYFYSGKFEGGEPLNDELLESIKAELFSTETPKADQSESYVTEAQSSENATFAESGDTTYTETNKDTYTEINETTYSECDDTSEKQSSETTEAQSELTVVYWTKNGSVWHTYRDCGHLSKSKEVESGSVEKAVEAGKEKLCSACAKKQN